jgi:hypothetical protein
MENFELRQLTLLHNDSDVYEAVCVGVRGQGIAVGYLPNTSGWEIEKETGM